MSKIIVIVSILVSSFLSFADHVEPREFDLETSEVVYDIIKSIIPGNEEYFEIAKLECSIVGKSLESCTIHVLGEGHLGDENVPWLIKGEDANKLFLLLALLREQGLASTLESPQDGTIFLNKDTDELLSCVKTSEGAGKSTNKVCTYEAVTAE